MVDVPGGAETTLRRLSSLTLVTADATVPIVGDLTDTPVLSPEMRARLDGGQSALAVVRGAGNGADILIARAREGAGTVAGVLWARIIQDSLWTTAQVYAMDIAGSFIGFQDDKGFCVVDSARRPVNCAGALVGWFAGGVPEDVRIPRDSRQGDLEWTTGEITYKGYYRLMSMSAYSNGNWHLMVAGDKRTILQPLAEFRNMLIGFVVLAAGIVLLVSGFFIQQSMEPLAKLREGTRRVAARDFSARVLVSSGDELEELAGSFNDMAEQVGTLVEELRDLSWGTITTLARTIDAKSPWTAGHSERVAELSVALARVMGLGDVELERLYRGALLHDIGKIGVPAAILNKNGRLTAEEMAVMQSHVTIGVRILEPLTALRDVIPVLLCHHERMDGKGYPAQLAGIDIPQLARILCVADTYDAIRSERPYRHGRSPAEALEEIVKCSGSQFDPEAVGALVQYMSSEEGELASVGIFSKPFGMPAVDQGTPRTLAQVEGVEI